MSAKAHDVSVKSQVPGPSSSLGMPNLGRVGVSLRLIIVSELIAALATLARHPTPGPAASRDFILLSVFALSVAAGLSLCLLIIGRSLQRLAPLRASLIILALLALVIAVVSHVLALLLVNSGEIHPSMPLWPESLLVRALAIGLALGVVGLRYFIVADRGAQDARRERESRQQALQSRIRPHFLFNSMNSIASLIRSDPERAEAALQDLADLFRVLLADARKLVPISAEREISRQYLEIEKLRLGNRLKVAWSVSNVPRNALIPTLTLQPLLENAIYHGIETRFGGGTVRIELWADGDQMLNVMITNPLPDVPKRAHGKGNQIAMDNIRERLQSHFGDRTTMQHFEENGQYHVKLRMPISLG